MENYLSLNEGVGYNEQSLPEQVQEPPTAEEIDRDLGFREPGEISEKEFEDLRKKLSHEESIRIAAETFNKFFQWVTAYKAPQTIYHRTLAAILVIDRNLLGFQDTPSMAAAVNNEKQLIHHHMESFRKTFNFHVGQRRGNARASQSVAALQSWARRRKKSEPQSPESQQ